MDTQDSTRPRAKITYAEPFNIESLDMEAIRSVVPEPGEEVTMTVKWEPEPEPVLFFGPNDWHYAVEEASIKLLLNFGGDRGTMSLTWVVPAEHVEEYASILARMKSKNLSIQISI